MTLTINDLMENVSKDWEHILLGDHMRKLLQSVLKTIGNDAITPDKPDIFKFARVTPFNRIKLVILGHEPYYSLNYPADGLAFSTKGSKCPRSLRSIISALRKSHLIKNMPQHYTLNAWAKQGILLLNTSLTVRPWDAGSHVKIWRLYMDNVITRIAHAKKNLIWLLLGANTKNKIKFIDASKHIILSYAHPANYTVDFTICPHFKTIQKYHKFNWNIL